MVGRPQEKKAMKEVLIFLVRFNLLLIPFYTIILLDISFYPLQTAFANLLASLLSNLNYPVRVSDFLLFIGKEELPIDISRDCIGWKSMYSLFALVFATYGKKKDKLRFLVVWLPVLFFINIFRTLITIIVGLNFGYQYLELVHTAFWQYIMVFSLIGIWYLWLRGGRLNIQGTTNYNKGVILGRG